MKELTYLRSKIALLVLSYLRLFARIQLWKYSPDCIGITGSAGKTSARNAIYAILKDKYKTKVSFKANSESGISLNILGLNMLNFSILDWLRVILLAPWKIVTLWRPHERYVVEMGIDSPEPPKNMDYLLSIVQPRTAIFLNVQPIHSMFFDKLVKDNILDSQLRRQKIRQLIGREKGKLIQSLPSNGLAILNADDDVVFQFKDSTNAQVMLFGKKTKISNSRLDIFFDKIKHSPGGTRFTFYHKDEVVETQFKNFLLPEHFGYTFAAALCIGIDEGYSLRESVNLLKDNYELPKGRSSVIPGIKGSLIIDSSYNASAKPTIDLISLVANLEPKRFVLLFGDMRELGKESRGEHEMVAEAIVDKVDDVYLIGPLTRQYVLPFLERNKYHIKHTVKWFSNARLAANQLKNDLRPGDMVLAKGSQNTIFLEEAVKLLMRNPNKAKDILCRQNSFWEKTRSQYFETI